MGQVVMFPAPATKPGQRPERKANAQRQKRKGKAPMSRNHRRLLKERESILSDRGFKESLIELYKEEVEECIVNQFRIEILLKIAEPMTEENRAAKIDAYRAVAEWLEDEDEPMFDAVRYLGLTPGQIRKLVRSGELETFEDGEGAHIPCESIRRLLIKWAEELERCGATTGAA